MFIADTDITAFEAPQLRREPIADEVEIFFLADAAEAQVNVSQPTLCWIETAAVEDFTKDLKALIEKYQI